MIPVALLLSNCNGVGPCMCPSSSRVCRSGTASTALLNPDPVSASCTDDMTASMILLCTWIGALRRGLGWSGVMGSLGFSVS